MPTVRVRTLATGGKSDGCANRPGCEIAASDRSSPISPFRVMRILTRHGIVDFREGSCIPRSGETHAKEAIMRRINLVAPALGGFLAAASGIAFLAWIAGARAEPTDPAPAVDLELILAADVSGSMTKDELRIQREGYVNALRNMDVINATLSGTRGRIAIAYFEWASPNDQRLIMPWTVIDGPDSARSFADVLEEQPYGGLERGGTSISGALSFSSRLLQSSGLQADRQVIDVSGDGPNNCGPPISPIRDGVISRGATINGLAISPSKRASSGATDAFGKPTLEWYYKGCVIGGPGAFLITVGDRAEFEKAIRRKLVLEIAGAPPRIELAAESLSLRPDCFSIGQSPGR
jgi:hypothetical protein